LLEAFEEMGDSFDKINDKAQALTDIIDSYTSIVSLTRQFVEVDSVLIQKMIDAKQELSKTSLSTSKSEYEKLLAA
jgi:hypothetical protein